VYRPLFAAAAAVKGLGGGWRVVGAPPPGAPHARILLAALAEVE
jgi:hypothetical protein